MTHNEKFKAEFVELWRSSVVRNRTKGLIDQYQRHFGNQVEVDYVLAEVYIRAVRTVEGGKPIQNLPAWLRATSINVVRELYRTEIRERKLEGKTEQELSPESVDPDEFCDIEDPTVHELWVRLKDLCPIEQKILMWEAEGKPYRLIAELLVKEEFETTPVSENAIAQRVRRARKKLKAIPPRPCP
jgi:DNA-directed RNA polymerase specialized sigma24 family protein